MKDLLRSKIGKNIITRFISVMLILTLVFSLAGCSAKGKAAPAQASQQSQQTDGIAESVTPTPAAGTETEEKAEAKSEEKPGDTPADETGPGETIKETATPAPDSEPSKKVEKKTEKETDKEKDKEQKKEEKKEKKEQKKEQKPKEITEDGYYYDVESVVLYYEQFGKLPSNYITKDEAKKLGWEGGSAEQVRKGAAIGGDHFGNYEKLLPSGKGIKYIECDIDTKKRSRGAKRLIISNDGRYYYTKDHYESFTEVLVKDGKVTY